MKIRIGTRSSKLALTQSYYLRDLLLKQGNDVEIIEISTIGDRIRNKKIEDINKKGVFVRDIEQKLLDNEIDLALHSLKDMPSYIDSRLIFANPPVSADPRDVFIGKNISSLSEMRGLRIGTGSSRRISQLKNIVADADPVPIRGNIDTRIKKIETENLDGVILAKAGIDRMKRSNEISLILDPKLFIPSPCQGILGLEIRKEDRDLLKKLETVSDPVTSKRMNIERTFQISLGASCTSPLGIYTEFSSDRVNLYGCFSKGLDSRIYYRNISGNISQAETLSIELANKLREDVDEK